MREEQAIDAKKDAEDEAYINKQKQEELARARREESRANAEFYGEEGKESRVTSEVNKRFLSEKREREARSLSRYIVSGQNRRGAPSPEQSAAV